MLSKNKHNIFFVIYLGPTLILIVSVFCGSGPFYMSYSYAQNVGQQISVNVIIVQGSSLPNNGHFFVPSVTEIRQNTKISWTNKDAVIHTVNSATNNTGISSFNSGLIKPGDSWSAVTFNKSGIFTYYCSIYPWMVGKIIVK